jgi:hypothetical protein
MCHTKWIPSIRHNTEASQQNAGALTIAKLLSTIARAATPPKSFMIADPCP